MRQTWKYDENDFKPKLVTTDDVEIELEENNY